MSRGTIRPEGQAIGGGTETPSGPAAPAAPSTRALRPPAYVAHHYLAILAFVVATIVVTRFFVTTEFGINLVNQWLLYSIVAIGFYLVFCVAGRFAFCQTFMMALSAYTAAYVSQHHAFWLGMLAGIGIVMLFSAAFGLLVSRTEDFFFAVATLALSEVGTAVFVHWNSFTGPNGLRSGVRAPSAFGRELLLQKDVFWLFLVAVTACLVITVLVARSPAQRNAVVARDNPEAARTCGIRIERVQWAMFILGSMMGGLGGALGAFWQGSVSTDSFGVTLAIGIFLMPILGGMDSMWGPVAGALFYVELPQILSGFSQWAPLIYGALLLLTIVAMPEGLIGFARRLRSRWGRRSPNDPTEAELRRRTDRFWRAVR